MKTKNTAEALKGPDARSIQRMFAAIAPRYDLLNHVLSASVDRRWRRVAAGRVAEHVDGRKAVCLDLCAGTGDLSLALCRRTHAAVIASDFCHPMLTRSLAKCRRQDVGDRISVVEADALTTPFPEESFDAVTIAFGLRNLEDPVEGLREMRRVLKRDGIAVILEFSRPVVPVLREFFGLYFHNVLPRLGAWVSGDENAYRYLPDSVRRFPSQDELVELMERAGFRDVGYRNLSCGIAALHSGLR